ncbi:AAEL013502-PA [Aedes aegypti]|uniref:AAEL013502-PA n=1 Tax=Aedes aegypti TaxID=7159 RepID=Q16IZ5_AEDAE|nr:AAEL013502-PA [Aedes aegypti]
MGFERKNSRDINHTQHLKPEEIDPLTLFIGNLPNAVTVYTVKQMFPTARRIDIGHAQRMKHTRYAFIRFHNVGDAIAAFKANFNKVIDGKNIIVRFRRHNAPIAMPEDTNTPKTPKRQKGLGQLFVSVEQKPTRNVRSIDKPHNLEIHHSDTLNTIRTDILDEDIVKNEMAHRHRVKIEPPEIPENDIEEEESDDIEDFLEDDEAEDLNLDEINADDNYCEDDDTDVDAIDKNYWTLEQLRSKASNDGTTSVSESIKSDIFMEPESATKTSCSTTFTTKPKDHKPVSTFIVSKRRDDQLQDLFSCLEPDDDLSL